MEYSGKLAVKQRVSVLSSICEGIFINLKHMQLDYIYFQRRQWVFHVIFMAVCLNISY